MEKINEVENRRRQKIKSIIRQCYDVETFSDTFFQHIKKKHIGTPQEQVVPTPDYHKQIWDSMKEHKDTVIIVPR